MSTTFDKLKTRVVNLTNREQYVFFLPPYGDSIPALSSVLLPWPGGLDAILRSGRMSQRRMGEEIQKLLEAQTIAIVEPPPTVLDVSTGTLKEIISTAGTVTGVNSAQEELPDPPSPAPTFGTTTTTSIVVNWTKPTNHGTRPITGYILQYKANADSEWTDISVSGENTLTRTVTGLTTGTTYNFRLKTVTAVGNSAVGSQANHATS